MAKFCEMCGKSSIAGNRIQHHHSIQWRYKAPKTSRTFKPNLRNVNMEINGRVKKVQVCMKCYKRLRKDQPEVYQAQIEQGKESTKDSAK
jgi:large subunit ribosomal protein L28